MLLVGRNIGCFEVHLIEKIDKRKKDTNKEPKKVMGLVNASSKSEAEDRCLREYPSYIVEKITNVTKEIDDMVIEEKVVEHRVPRRGRPPKIKKDVEV
jgi:hypothetical protein